MKKKVRIRSDHEREFQNKFTDCHRIVERKNITIQEMALVMLHAKKISYRF